VNLSLAALNGAVVSGLCALCYTIAARAAAPWRFGPFQVLALPLWLRIALEVLTLDLLVYLFHRVYHRVPAFWRFHRVHHTDLDLDVTSASRFHLGVVLISAAGKLPAVVTLGISPVGLVSFEVVMLLAARSSTGTCECHSLSSGYSGGPSSRQRCIGSITGRIPRTQTPTSERW
jgi:sterol desaturase/sphingolipid hydroxylase (fatty acid hydroxylase superfamily)